MGGDESSFPFAAAATEIPAASGTPFSAALSAVEEAQKEELASLSLGGKLFSIPADDDEDPGGESFVHDDQQRAFC